MQKSVIFRPKSLSLAVATILGVAVMPAQATLLNYTISTETGYQIGDPLYDEDSNSDSDPSWSSSYIDRYGSDADTSGGASGNDVGWMYSRSYGVGAHYHQFSTVTQSVDVLNSSGLAQLYSYDFSINRGSLDAENYGFTTSEEFSTAGYIVDISVDGNSLWSSMFTLDTDINGSQATYSGTMLGSYQNGDSYYWWSAFSDTLNLGVWGAGESFNLTYSITTFVQGNHLKSCDNGYGNYGTANLASVSAVTEDCGYGEYGEYGSWGSYTGYTYAQFGDPNGFSTVPVAFNDNNIRQNSTSVPEPASIALLGAGLAGLAFRRRRKTQ
ncbi:hypothetical protein GCM10009092_22180 [Bowmanella denitrificans]|uniref:Ice-binding protein C-terminal domain-containing protein n=1 Tax=Bowmanella denitrificans TaxID=366582 RepID=A0ABN0X872_9ALTE